LRQQIQDIDRQLSECKKNKKNWTAATIIGSVGVVGSGVLVGIEANKLVKSKKEKSNKESDETEGENDK
jgi:uncharacterized protein YlxW (UPF0749 family)